MTKEKETVLNEALRNYQIEKPKTKFWNWCLRTGFAHKFDKQEEKEALEISKTLKV